jgi:hypothetical protein
MLFCNVNIIFKVLFAKKRTNGKNLKRLRKIKGMCIMIVSVSILFFVLEFPILIFICLMQGEWLSPELPFFDLFWTIMNLMMYTNHVINFLSYCMTGTKFRRELFRLLSLNTLLSMMPCCKCIGLNEFVETTTARQRQRLRSTGTWNNNNKQDDKNRFITLAQSSFHSLIRSSKSKKASTKNKQQSNDQTQFVENPNTNFNNNIKKMNYYNDETIVNLKIEGEPFIMKVFF